MSALKESTTKKLSIGGAVVAAILASSCCIGPLVLAGLGVGAAGAFGGIGAYRPYILAVAAMLLGGGFYFTYRRKEGAHGDACGCERPKAARAGKLGLWVATVMVGLFAVAPSLIAKAYNAGATRPTAAETTSTASAIILVRGADCEACAGHLKDALRKAGGFHDLSLDTKTQRIRVTYEPAPARLEAYVRAIDDLGYEAEIVR